MNMYKLYYSSIDSLNDYDINELSSYRLNKINEYKNIKDKKLSLLAGLLFSKGLKELYNLDIKDIELEFNEFNKPFIKNYPSIHFNISHSNSLVVLVFSSFNIGIDVEYIHSLNNKIINKYYSLKEKEYIFNSINKDKEYTRIWTLKESFFKCLGIGINDKMNEVSFIINNNLINIEQNINTNKYLIEIKEIDNYLISIIYEMNS